MNILIAFVVGLFIGIALGLLRGRRGARKKFYKYPSSHWKIRGR